HQSLLAQGRDRVLVANRENDTAATILNVGEDDVGQLFSSGLVKNAQLQQFRTSRVGAQLDPHLSRIVPVFPPCRQPLLQQLGGDFGLNQVLEVGRSLAHRFGCRSASRRSYQRAIQPWSSHQRLRRSIGRLQQPELALQTRQGKHPVLLQSRGELLGRQAVD